MPKKAKLIPSKAGKRILGVTIRRIVDDSPDTSHLGEYSDKSTSPFSIDRATDEFQGDTDAGKDWLDRVDARLAEAYDELNESLPAEDQLATDWLFQLDAAIDTVNQLRADLDDDGSWNRREYRYFNPGSVEPYKVDAAWLKRFPESERKKAYSRIMRENARQDYKRMERLNAGDWCYIGIRAEAEIGIGDVTEYPKRYNVTTQHISSGGLWGIESDAEESYFTEVEGEELASLKEQLSALGFSKRAISTAFKSIEREGL